MFKSSKKYPVLTIYIIVGMAIVLNYTIGLRDIRGMINQLIVSMGFRSAWEFVRSLFGVWYAEIIIIVSGAVTVLCVGVGTAHAFVSEYIYSPPVMMVMVMSALALDWLTGVYGAIHRRDFQTDKAKRIIPISITNVIFLMGLYHAETKMLSEVSESAVSTFHIFRITVTNYMFFVPFLSAMVNASKYGLINIKLIHLLSEYVDTHKPT